MWLRKFAQVGSIVRGQRTEVRGRVRSQRPSQKSVSVCSVSPCLCAIYRLARIINRDMKLSQLGRGVQCVLYINTETQSTQRLTSDF
jgi:hypothetical protein